MRVNTSGKRESDRIEVLSEGTMPTIGLAPIGTPVEGAPVDLQEVSPITGDATTRRPSRAVDVAKPERFRVESKDGRYVNDPNGGGRIFLREGKEILSTHYNIRDLQRQGVKLKNITAESVDEPLDC